MFILGHTLSFFMLLCLTSFFLGFSVLARILLFRYSPRPFSNTRPKSTIFRYSPRIYSFPILAQIIPFFGTHLDTISSPILDRIRSLLRYSTRYDLFSSTRLDTIFFVLDSPVLARIWSFLSRILRYSPRYDLFSCISSDTILSILDSPILAQIWSPVYIVFYGTRPDLIHFPLVYSCIVSGSLDLF